MLLGGVSCARGTCPSVVPAGCEPTLSWLQRSRRSVPIDVDNERVRGDPVRNDLELTEPGFLFRRYVEVRRHDIVGGNRHAAVVVSATVEHVPRAKVRDTHQRIDPDPSKLHRHSAR